MATLLSVTAALLTFFLGAAVFSFAGVVIYRLPRGMNYLTGRSICPGCGRTLRGYELVPVFSWLCQRGRCRSCGSQIGWRDFLLELLGGALALLCLWRFCRDNWLSGAAYLAAATAFCFFTLLIIVSFIDADTQEIPNGLVLAVLILAVLSYFTLPGPGLLARVAGGVCVSLPMLLLALVIPGAFGGGDIKLMFACGLLLGWRATVAAFFLALLTGGGYALWLLFTGRKGRKEQFSFGPFLCFGASVALLWGEALISAYLNLFGL